MMRQQKQYDYHSISNGKADAHPAVLPSPGPNRQLAHQTFVAQETVNTAENRQSRAVLSDVSQNSIINHSERCLRSPSPPAAYAPPNLKNCGQRSFCRKACLLCAKATLHKPIPQYAYAQQPQSVPAPSLSPVMAAPVKLIGVFGYIMTMLVFAIPVLGIVMAFVWALGKNTNPNRKNFARATLILGGVYLAGMLVWYFINMSAIKELVKVIIS